ncbi:hypothetical protein BCV04_009250 [Vibrio lentus]|nr:hypothetical protein [Vibrio lentus]
MNDAPELTGDLSAEVDEAGSYTITAADLGYTDVDDKTQADLHGPGNARTGPILSGTAWARTASRCAVWRRVK